ncbi:acyl-CoA dehydratase activase [Irregularibacter muris]|uniref:Acyl-CoA dehydratase activase n=1 Tax=Irregularibacter muris TaxID=1796619 RepID=A0AAE3HDX6_9FIRM|nr:acyl-CoA dehydratase activase [Irregularibacter muris]MCR1897680.1 acyl-CoA dehydratase activase [Irregularibacter muris]
MYTLGVDVGSTTSKCMILKDGKEFVSSSIVAAGTGTNGPERALEEVIEKAPILEQDIAYIVATGYGRTSFKIANEEVSELTCHARGVHFTCPDVRTIIDIGGQDVKVLALNEKGRMLNFLMNDKCAAGTGRFLDVMANILQLNIQDLEKQAAKSSNPVRISNTCTVFAESEVISQLALGVKLPDLVAGICESVARRVGSLAKRIGIREKVYMSGGVAQNGGVRTALESFLETDIVFTKDAQLMGALGAALLAYDKANK